MNLTFLQDSINIFATISYICQEVWIMKVSDFILQHAVFTKEELDLFLSDQGSNNINTRKSILSYYRKQGRIVLIRRGLYATIPAGSDPVTYPIDPFLITAKMTSDAILAYHTALEFHEKAYSIFNRLNYFSAFPSHQLYFQTREFRRVSNPPPLKDSGKEFFGVSNQIRSGVNVRVTSLERTFVDVLDRPELIGSWEEIWRSLEMIEFFDLNQIIEYVLLLGNATTASKVGFFLEQHQDTLLFDNTILNPLREMRPKQPHYLNRSKRFDCQLIDGWNLLMPEYILNKTWGEVL